MWCCATGEDGETIVTDMPKSVAGGGTVPPTGWLARATRARCDAPRMAMRAAELGILLDTLQVTTDSIDDDRSLFGLDKSIRAGSLSLRTRITIGAAGIAKKTLR